jgi:hypothetical protein
MPLMPKHIQLSKTIQLSSRERTEPLVINTLTNFQARVYWPLV